MTVYTCVPYLFDVILKDIWDFLSRMAGRTVDVSKLYTINDMGFRQLMPESFDGGRVNFAEIAAIYLPEFYAKWSINVVRAIIEKEIPRPEAHKGFNIDKQLLIVFTKKIIGRFKSIRIGNTILMAFHIGKTPITVVKHHIYNIIGKWYQKRAEKIEESTERKTGRKAWGSLAELVEFFKYIGKKLCKIAKKFFDAMSFRKCKHEQQQQNKDCCNYYCYYTSTTNSTTSNSNNNSRSNNNNNSNNNFRKVLTKIERVILNATPVLPENRKRIVI